MDQIQYGIGQIIKQIRKERQLSQQDLAMMTSLHRTFIGGVERGERNITIGTLMKLSEALNVPISAILQRAGF